MCVGVFVMTCNSHIPLSFWRNSAGAVGMSLQHNSFENLEIFVRCVHFAFVVEFCSVPCHPDKVGQTWSSLFLIHPMSDFYCKSVEKKLTYIAAQQRVI